MSCSVVVVGHVEIMSVVVVVAKVVECVIVVVIAISWLAGVPIIVGVGSTGSSIGFAGTTVTIVSAVVLPTDPGGLVDKVSKLSTDYNVISD